MSCYFWWGYSRILCFKKGPFFVLFFLARRFKWVKYWSVWSKWRFGEQSCVSIRSMQSSIKCLNEKFIFHAQWESLTALWFQIVNGDWMLTFFFFFVNTFPTFASDASCIKSYVPIENAASGTWETFLMFQPPRDWLVLFHPILRHNVATSWKSRGEMLLTRQSRQDVLYFSDNGKNDFCSSYCTVMILKYFSKYHSFFIDSYRVSLQDKSHASFFLWDTI